MSDSIEMSRGTTKALRIAGWSLAAGLLMLPGLAMQFTSEVDWRPADFLFAAIMFVLVGGMLELAARASAKLTYRVGAGLAVLACFLLVWINLAVGMVGAEDDPQNIVYFATVGMAITGAWVARGRARELARTMQAVGGAQLLIALMHVGAAAQAVPIDLFFAVLWFVSSVLFSRAAREKNIA